MLVKTESTLEGTITRRNLPIVLSKLSALSRSRFIMILAVIGLLIYGYVLASRASYAVGGSDSSGYAQIARSILNGELVRRVTGLDLFGLPNDFDLIFIPLAYDQGPQPGTMTSIYPIGFPMHLALGALIAGWEYGPYLVTPIVGLLSLVLIYLVGLELGLPRGFSIAGAVMLAASPTFIHYSTQPMSDVVAMFWSLAAILAALRSGKRGGWSLLAGAAFGMAVLTRPSSILLLIPILFILRLKFKNILFFILGGLPLAAIFFTYNAIAFGHPLETGYGRIGLLQDAVKISGFKERFNLYHYWIKVTMSPLPLLGWLVVAADRKVEWRNRAMLVSWFGAFFLVYSCYDFSGAWWWTRFLLPAYPAMILGALLVARDIVGLFGKWISEDHRARLRWIILAILLGVTLSHEDRNIKRFDLFNFGANEIAHKTSCHWADQAIPSHSLLAAGQMSGALDFYTQRPIVRYDWLDPVKWATVKKHAAERGYQWYALLMDFEIEGAQDQMGGRWTKLGVIGPISLWRIDLTFE
jgi:hypothetical protein